MAVIKGAPRMHPGLPPFADVISRRQQFHLGIHPTAMHFGPRRVAGKNLNNADFFIDRGHNFRYELLKLKQSPLLNSRGQIGNQPGNASGA
jgi:hypothetical protein